MRVGIDARQANPNFGTGWATIMRNLIRALAAIDHDNEYLLYEANAPYQCNLGELPENFRVKCIPHVRGASRLTGSPDVWWDLLLPTHLLLSRLQPDVFIAEAHRGSLRWFRGVFVALMLDVSFLKRPETFPEGLRQWIERQTWKALKRADVVLAISNNTKSDTVSHYPLQEHQIQVTPLGYDTSLFRPIHEPDLLLAVREKYGIHGPYVLAVGRLEPRKNFLRVLEAFRVLKRQKGIPHQLVIVGSRGWLGVEEALRQNVSAYGLSEDVILTGFVPERDLPVLMSGASVFVYPSLYEGFGLPVLEALACGAPVVTSNVSSLPEVTGDAAILVDPEDVEEMQTAMWRVISDSELRARLRRCGPEQAKKFSWEETARLTLAAIQRATAGIKASGEL